MRKRVLLSFFAMLLMSSAFGEGELNRFVDFEKNAAELKFVENPDFWAKEVDFSALSVWNDATKDMWGGGCEHRNLAGVAISPRHVLCSHHYGIPTGTTLYFLGPKSGVVGRKVLASDYVAQGADLRVCLLDVDLPRDIVPLKILPENYADYLGDGKGLISATMNQYRELITQKLLSIPGEENRTQLLSATKPAEVEDAAKYKTVISGDSGCPRFFLSNNEPVLISLMWKGGSGSGVFIPHFRREIQNIMNRLAKGYELGEVSLAALPLYTPPSTEIKSPAPSPTAPNSEDANSDADNGSDDEDDIYDFIIIEDEDGEEEEPVERVDIAAIVCTNGVIDIEFKWPSTMQINKWDVFLKGYAELGGEATLSKKYNPTSGTNLVVTITAADFPENVLPHKYFFKAEAIKDSDHDGLSDELERQIGTDPDDADSDHDGLNDKFEIDSGFNPKNDDMDGDGVKDGEECSKGTSLWISEDKLLEHEGIFYEIIGSPLVEEIPYDPTTNRMSRVALAEIPPNQPGTMSNIGYEIGDSTAGPYCKRKTGLKFKPTRSGIFAFQVAADDRAEVSIGSVISIGDSWQTRGEEAQGYFTAGIEYDITATIWNDGGRTYFNFVKFGVFKAYEFSLQNDITAGTIVFEDAYENKPGQNIPKNSTTTQSYVIASGGFNGGVLRIETEYISKLQCKYGRSISTQDIIVEPCEVCSLVGIYEGAAHSERMNDVKIRTIFTENNTGVIISKEVSLTVIEISVDVSYSEEGGRNRHVFGPLESVWLEYEPQDANVSWSGTSARVGTVMHEDGAYSYEIIDFSVTNEHSYWIQMPKEPGIYNITYEVEGISKVISLEVIAPKYMRGKDPVKASLSDWRNVAKNQSFVPNELYCGCVFDVDVYPKYVSFQHIRISEGECPASDAQGSLRNLGSHDEDAGAGRISTVDQANYAGGDFIGKYGVQRYNDSWEGSGNWNIPVFWQPEVESTNTWWRPAFTHNKQRFLCTSRGTLLIRKLDCIGQRNINGLESYKERKR